MNIAPRLEAFLKGPRYTLWTFIKYHEKSKDPAHCRRLKKQMEAKLREEHRRGNVVRCRSIGGKVSYAPRSAYGDIPF